MKEYLEKRIIELQQERDDAFVRINNKQVGLSEKKELVPEAISKWDTIKELEQALNYLNAQNESQNVTGNECEKEYCKCHITMSTLEDLSFCISCDKPIKDE